MAMTAKSERHAHAGLQAVEWSSSMRSYTQYVTSSGPAPQSTMQTGSTGLAICLSLTAGSPCFYPPPLAAWLSAFSGTSAGALMTHHQRSSSNSSNNKTKSCQELMACLRNPALSCCRARTLRAAATAKLVSLFPAAPPKPALVYRAKQQLPAMVSTAALRVPPTTAVPPESTATMTPALAAALRCGACPG